MAKILIVDDDGVARDALDYLTKPADIEKLEGIIGTFLRSGRGPASQR